MGHDAVVLETCGEISEVEIDDRVFVQVLLKRRVGGNRKVGKKMARITRAIVIGAQHLGGHRLAETTATRHATETPLREKRIINDVDKPRLVNILTVPHTLEPSIADIDICAHGKH